MNLELMLLKTDNVLNGLQEHGSSVNSISQIMTARVKTPVISDGIDIWHTSLDSKTVELYGGVNEDGGHRFKIDHEFDISMLVNANIIRNRTLHFPDSTVYDNSHGTEFIVILRSDIRWYCNFAIRADKYASVREQLAKGKLEKTELENAGGFKIRRLLGPADIVSHDGWLELAVGKNNSSEQDYALARDLLSGYVKEAKERGCFRIEYRHIPGIPTEQGGMGFFGFFVWAYPTYAAQVWYIEDSIPLKSSVCAGASLVGINGKFIRVGNSFAEGYHAQQLSSEPSDLSPQTLRGTSDVTEQNLGRMLFDRAARRYNTIGNYLLRLTGKGTGQ